MKRNERYLSEEEETQEIEARRLAGPMTLLVLLLAWVAIEVVALLPGAGLESASWTALF